MQINIKKPSELKSEIPTPIDNIHMTSNGRGISCFCPDCGAEHTFTEEWPIDIPIVCSIIDSGDVCRCRFIIPNDVNMED